MSLRIQIFQNDFPYNIQQTNKKNERLYAFR